MESYVRHSLSLKWRLAVVLLIGAGLMMKSFIGVMLESPGFNADNTLTVAIGLPEAKYPEAHEQMAFYSHWNRISKAFPACAPWV